MPESSLDDRLDAAGIGVRIPGEMGSIGALARTNHLLLFSEEVKRQYPGPETPRKPKPVIAPNLDVILTRAERKAAAKLLGVPFKPQAPEALDATKYQRADFEKLRSAIQGVREGALDSDARIQSFLFGPYQFFRDGRVSKMNRVTGEMTPLEPHSEEWVEAKAYLAAMMAKAKPPVDTKEA